VNLRELELSDAPAWLAGEDEEQLRWFQMPAASLRDVERAIDRWRAGWRDDGPVRQWGIWVDESLAGGVEVRVREDGRANVSYVVFPPFRRQGHATAAVVLAVAWAAEHLAVEEFVAVIDERNLASREVAERAGFTLDGAAEPWEHAESGPMLRYMFSSARS
jgi:RimJ/RimL family protein N-acetyltransferase